jgi:AcrR family transcriptional regulator
MADVAARAGVGKQTVHRWWSTKASLVADCVLEGTLPIDADLVIADDDPVTAVRTWLTLSATRLSQPEQAALFRALNAAASSDEAARAKLADRFHDPLVAAISESLEAGTAQGVFRAGVPTSVVAEMLIGALSYSLLRPGGLPESWVDDVLSTLLQGIADPD